MKKILKIAEREYVQTVRTKAFFIGLFALPVIIFITIFFFSRLARDKAKLHKPLQIALTDKTGQLESQLKTAFEEYNDANPNREIRISFLNNSDNFDT